MGYVLTDSLKGTQLGKEERYWDDDNFNPTPEPVVVTQPVITTPATTQVISEDKLNSMRFMYFNRASMRPQIKSLLLKQVMNGQQIVANWENELAELNADQEVEANIQNDIENANQAATDNSASTDAESMLPDQASFIESDTFQKYGRYAVYALGAYILYDTFMKPKRKQIGFNR